MVFGAPQITFLVLYVLNLGVALAKHGEEEIRQYNFISRTVGILIQIGLLYWGGFFS